jgi:hypothetical protein
MLCVSVVENSTQFHGFAWYNSSDYRTLATRNKSNTIMIMKNAWVATRGTARKKPNKKWAGAQERKEKENCSSKKNHVSSSSSFSASSSKPPYRP